MSSKMKWTAAAVAFVAAAVAFALMRPSSDEKMARELIKKLDSRSVTAEELESYCIAMMGEVSDPDLATVTRYICYLAVASQVMGTDMTSSSAWQDKSYLEQMWAQARRLFHPRSSELADETRWTLDDYDAIKEAFARCNRKYDLGIMVGD